MADVRWEPVIGVRLGLLVEWEIRRRCAMVHEGNAAGEDVGFADSWNLMMPIIHSNEVGAVKSRAVAKVLEGRVERAHVVDKRLTFTISSNAQLANLLFCEEEAPHVCINIHLQ